MLLPRNLLASPQPGESLLPLSSHPADCLDLSEVLSYSFLCVGDGLAQQNNTQSQADLCLYAQCAACYTCMMWNTSSNLSLSLLLICKMQV